MALDLPCRSRMSVATLRELPRHAVPPSRAVVSEGPATTCRSDLRSGAGIEYPPHEAAVDEPDPNIARMNVTTQEGLLDNMHFHYLDTHPSPYAKRLLSVIKRAGWLSDDQLSKFKSQIELGKKMTLREAVRYAISLS